jgi:hypothetical protein
MTTLAGARDGARKRAAFDGRPVAIYNDAKCPAWKAGSFYIDEPGKPGEVEIIQPPTLINATDTAVQNLLFDWHEAGRAAFQDQFKNLDYDSDAYRKFARERRRYICLDEGNGGAYILDRLDGMIYRIKSKYGVPQFRLLMGHLGEVTGQMLNCHRWANLRRA